MHAIDMHESESVSKYRVQCLKPVWMLESVRLLAVADACSRPGFEQIHGKILEFSVAGILLGLFLYVNFVTVMFLCLDLVKKCEQKFTGFVRSSVPHSKEISKVKKDVMPRERSRNARRLQDRLIDELIGISRGVIADGVVDESEAIFIGQWIESHREIADKWPVNVLYARITELLKDGTLTADEQKQLLETLKEITGGDISYMESTKSTTLPLTRPEPELMFEGGVFALTGKFVFGSNTECESVITDLGGTIVPAPTVETDYLVIGELGSREWAHSAFGRSIENAIELQANGSAIAIVSEEHWVDELAGEN